MSRKEFGNEETILMSWKLWVIELYNKRTIFLKKQLRSTQLGVVELATTSPGICCALGKASA